MASVRDWPSDPGDSDIFAVAATQRRVVVTVDRGFGALSVQRVANAGIIIIGRASPAEHVALCLRAISEHEADLLAGAIVIATPTKMRVRPSRADA